jgi:hypothetical protein
MVGHDVVIPDVFLFLLFAYSREHYLLCQLVSAILYGIQRDIHPLSVLSSYFSGTENVSAMSLVMLGA